MYDVEESSRVGSYKGSRRLRKIRYGMDVQKVKTFDLAWKDEKRAPFLNIATSVLMTTE